jgi:hypothetical protein
MKVFLTNKLPLMSPFLNAHFGANLTASIMPSIAEGIAVGGAVVPALFVLVKGVVLGGLLFVLLPKFVFPLAVVDVIVIPSILLFTPPPD